MKVSTEKLTDCEVALIIEVDKDRVEKAMRRVARRLASRVKIPGFRPGKAPYEVVRDHLGEDLIFAEMLEELGQEVYREALEKSGIEPFLQGHLESVQRDPLTLRVIVPLMPKVDLGDYRNLRLPRPEVRVDEEEVEWALNLLREEHALWKPVNRPARADDLLVVEVRGTKGQKEVLKEEKVTLQPQERPPYPLPPHFRDAVLGMAPGEERECVLVYPLDFPHESLAGQEIRFHIHLHEVKEKELPPLDDDLARTVGKFETLEELREAVRQDLLAQACEEMEDELVFEALRALVEKATVKFPPQLLEKEIERLRERRLKVLESRGLTLDNYLRFTGKAKEEFEAELRSQAEERLRRNLVLTEFIRAENISVTPEELERACNRGGWPYPPDEKTREYIETSLLMGKALRRLATIVKGEEPEKPGSEEEEQKASEGEP